MLDPQRRCTFLSPPCYDEGDEDTAIFGYHGVVALAKLASGAHLCWTALSDGKPDLDATFHDALKVGTLWHSLPL